MASGTARAALPGELTITVEDGGDRAVCRLTGELDALNAPRLRAVLVAQLEAGSDAVIDLAGLRFIDSSGLGVLVGALRRYQGAGHRLTLRSPSSAIRRVLEMTGVAGAFPVESPPTNGGRAKMVP